MSHKTACASFVWGSLVAAGVLLSGSLSAQTSTEPDILTVSIEELSKTKVYTASRRLENSRQAPSAVTVVTAEEIREYGWRTLADVLRTVRGFYTAYDRDYTYLGVRGFMRSGDYNSRILLLINGHRMNDNVYDSAHVGTEFPLDLDLVDHIEIVRGPSSSLFGTNAVFGVINVITRRASKGMALEVSADSSSFGGRAGRAKGYGTREARSRQAEFGRGVPDSRLSALCGTGQTHSWRCIGHDRVWRSPLSYGIHRSA